MSLFLKISIPFVMAVCLGTFFCAADSHAAMDSRFELDPQTVAGLKGTPKSPQVREKRSSRRHAYKPSSTAVKGNIYTVKAGDHLFKILMRDYGLSNNEAESFIEEIKRENNIYDIKRLKIGQKITIPPVLRHSDGSLKLLQKVRVDNLLDAGSCAVPKHSLNIESPLSALSDQETVVMAHDMWKRIVPPKRELQKPLAFQTSNFSLTLDPERYPTFTRMDGGRIVFDLNATIPPLVKSLIEDKDASVRIITGAPSGTNRFMASLLNAGGFYSVEENFSMEFGVDPKLTVKADFKVEKTPESLINQDVTLVNSGRTLLPSSIGEFLKKEGFSLYEPFASLKPFAPVDSCTIYSVSSKKQPEAIDSILSAFAISPVLDRSVDVFAADNNGITLSVKAERYFERGGQRYIVTSFDGDPINYTLFRILETKGYKVVIIEARDDFRKIAEKLISRMKIKGVFDQHTLLQDGSAGYSLKISGFKLDDPLLPGGGIFLTDRVMDPIVRALFTENGFNLNSR
jgi:hypothetical protein